MAKRILSFSLALLALILLFPAMSVSVDAAYENTYVNTGNQAADIIGVAKTQLGYTEGSNNYTKYGVRFNLPNTAWCGLFVAWCAEQAGVPSSVLRRYFIAEPTGYGLTALDGRNYRPQPGDLFFKRSYSHVGLVYYVEGDYFYTLEGNSGPDSNKVYSQRKKISDHIFGHPNYYGSGDHSYSTGYDSAHPHKEYKLCSHCSDKYYTGATSSAADCKTCIQNACSHNYSAWAKESDSKHTRTCSVCGKIDTSNHEWNSGKILTEATCAKKGSKEQTCSKCNFTRTVSIDKTTNHKFGNYVLLDDKEHRRECSICHTPETKSHTVNEQWLTDEIGHWYECIDCAERYAYAEHSFPDGCESPCEVCGYLSAEGHILSAQAQHDGDGHWFDCRGCDKKVDYQAHHFSADCAERCEECSFQRQTIHSYGADWVTNGAEHWKQCTVCGNRDTVAGHTADSEAKDWEDQLCTVCHLVLRSGDSHLHSYQNIERDGRTHWGVCACGFEMPQESHSWSMQTKKCSICGANNISVGSTSDTQQLIYWCAAVLGGVGLLSALAFILGRIGRKTSAKTKRIKTPA